MHAFFANRKVIRNAFLCVFFFLLQIQLPAQEELLDSIGKLLSKNLPDTERVNLLTAWIDADYNDERWPLKNEEIKTICEKNLKTEKNKLISTKNKKFDDAET